MSGWLWVGVGGFLGAIGRYLVGLAVVTPAAGRFPVATFAVNAVGCLLIGLLAGLWDRSPALYPELRLFLFTGLLGGFTTFSAFGLETVLLLRRGDWGTAAVYVLASVAVGLVAVAVGLRLARPGELP